jgi:multicomponent Na+:H+ antiporter subunit G
MIAYLFIFLGLVLMFFGTLGIIRFPDIYTRLQTSSKCDAAGAIALLVGLMVREGLDSLSLRILIILVFLLLTNPVASHAIARSAAIRGIKPWRKKKKYLKKGG